MPFPTSPVALECDANTRSDLTPAQLTDNLAVGISNLDFVTVPSRMASDAPTPAEFSANFANLNAGQSNSIPQHGDLR